MVRITKLKLHRVVSDIMLKGNLDDLTARKIRLLCEQKYNIDLSDRKKDINDIVLEFVRNKCSSPNDTQSSSNQNNGSEQHSSDENGSKDGSGEEESDEEETSCSGSESCSNSECSSSESSDDELNRKKVQPKNAITNVSTSKKIAAVASTSRELIAVASTSKEPAVVASTSKESPVPANRSMKNITAPPKKRMSIQSINTADDDVAAIAEAAAVDMPLKKQKTVDVNNKCNAVVPSKKTNKADRVRASNGNANNSSNNNKTEMDDLALARQLQAEEWNFRRGTVSKLFRNTPQKKIDKDKQVKKKACPFLKKCMLSPALAELLGTNEMSRPDIVQKMWSIVRERNLFDPSNKQFILCDEQLANIFGKKRIRLIGMMKYLKQHVKDVTGK